MKLVLLLFALLIAPFTAAAQAHGDVAGTFDGAEIAFNLWADQSDWSGSEANISVDIFTRRHTASVENLPQMYFGLEITDGKVESIDLTVSQQDTSGSLHSFYNVVDDRFSITLDDMTIEGDTLYLSGKIEGPIGPSPDYGDTIDETLLVPLIVTFDMVLNRS